VAGALARPEIPGYVSIMGIDHDIMAEGPCPCGQGAIEVERQTPDHSWPSGQWVKWSADLKCALCRERYAFVGLTLVHKADAEAHFERLSRLRQAEEALTKLPIVPELRRAIAHALDAMPSKAARHRWLNERGLASETYATFSKHWRGGTEWALYGVRSRNLVEVASALGIDPAPVNEHLALIAGLREATWAKMEPIPTRIRHLTA
jgi:hypothetical protein